MVARNKQKIVRILPFIQCVRVKVELPTSFISLLVAHSPDLIFFFDYAALQRLREDQAQRQ